MGSASYRAPLPIWGLDAENLDQAEPDRVDPPWSPGGEDADGSPRSSEEKWGLPHIGRPFRSGGLTPRTWIRLSPIGLTLRGPRVAKTPTVRPVPRRRNGVCLISGAPSDLGA